MPVENVRNPLSMVDEDRRPRKQDPQYVLYATVKQSHRSDSEVITFSRWSSNGLTEECFIVPIPDAERDSVVVFAKVKHHDSPPPRYYESLRRQLNVRDDYRAVGDDYSRVSGQTPQDKLDARDD
jgi:hypothetical protein